MRVGKKTPRGTSVDCPLPESGGHWTGLIEKKVVVKDMWGVNERMRESQR